MLRLLPPSVILAIIALALAGQPANAQDGAASQTDLFLPIINQEPAALCRFGVNKDINNVNISPLRTGWYLTYGSYSAATAAPSGVSFLPTIRLTQTGTETYEYSIFANHAATTEQMLKKAIAAQPGAEWFIGNEPDRRDRKIANQDAIEPQVYAIAYHDLYNLIKQEDPTATIIAGSIVQATDVRLKYLNKVLTAYKQRYGTRMPVDVWAIHNFILNEVSCDVYPDSYTCWGADIPPGIDDDKGMVITFDQNDDIELFKTQIQRFRQWLADKGYAGTPIYVSEYGVLLPYPHPDWSYPPERVNRFMDATFDYMLNTTDPVLGDPTDGYRLVQRFSWYSVHDGTFNGDLYTAEGALTAMGANYGSYTADIASVTDFYPVTMTVGSLAAPSPSSTSVVGLDDLHDVFISIVLRSIPSVKLTAQIANSGNVAAAYTAIVRFYDGNPAGKGVQIGQDQLVRLAGCGQDAEVSVQWTNPAPGQHNLFVVVEPQRAGRESNDANNTLKITATIGSSAAAPSVFHAIGYRAHSVMVPSS